MATASWSSGITGGGRGSRVPPRDFWLGNFCRHTRKKEARKKRKRGKMEKKRRKIVKGKVENWKWKKGKFENEERTFFFFSLFKTTKICFGATKMEIFYWEKAFHAGKKFRKMILPPQKNFPFKPLSWSTLKGYSEATVRLPCMQ